MQIYDFEDYRSFLKACFLKEKKVFPKMSFVWLARKIGCSESFLKKLFAKKTHLGLKHANRLFAALGLSGYERRYIYFWLLREVTNDHEIQNDLKYILSILKHRGQSGLTHFDEKEEKKSIDQEIECSEILVHAALEMSRIYSRPAHADDLRRDLLPGILSRGDLDRAANSALNILKKRNPDLLNPIHDHQSGYVSGLATDALRSMKEVANLSADVSDHLHDYGPFTIYASLEAVDSEKGSKALEILRRARTEIINLKSEVPSRVMAIQIQGYFITSAKPNKND